MLSRIFLSIAISLSAHLALSRDFILAVSETGTLYDMNPITGEPTGLTSIWPNPGAIGGLCYDRHTGILYVSSELTRSLYKVNITTGEQQLVGAFNDTNVRLNCLEFGSDPNFMFGTSQLNGRCYQINKQTAQPTFSCFVPFTGAVSLGYDSDQAVMYATSTQTRSLYTFNPLNGQANLIGPLVNSNSPHGLAYNYRTQELLLIDVLRGLCTVDMATGLASPKLYGSNSAMRGLAYIETPELIVKGTIQLQDYVGPLSGVEVELDFYYINSLYTNRFVERKFATLDSLGRFTITTDGLVPGVYDVYAQTSHWLRKLKINVTIPTDSPSALIISLINGDCNLDGEVNLLDLGFVSAAFGSTTGDANWNEMADLNGDEEVNLFDFAIVAANYGEDDDGPGE